MQKQKIAEQITLQIPADKADKFWEIIKEYFAPLFASSRLSWGVAAVQLAVIILLFAGLPKDSRFKTLTGGLFNDEGIRIHVIFRKESMEWEIREVLQRIGATIVEGPSQVGMYTIRVKEEEETADRAVGQLKETKIVKFAERDY